MEQRSKSKTVPRCCWLCRFIHYSPGTEGEDGYSEVTPGYPREMPELRCGLEHWEINFVNDTEEELRDKILTAERCPDFTSLKDKT